MTKHSFIFHTISLLACIVLLASCSPQSLAAIEQNVDPISASTQLPENELKTLTPTSTAMPVDTPVPSPTPMEWPSQPITPDNLDSLTELNSWGRGSVIQIKKLYSQKNEYFVLTPQGLYWYEGTSPSLLTFIPDADDFVLSADEHLLAASMKNGDVEIWAVDSMSLKQTISHVFPEDIVKGIEEHKLLPYYVGGMTFSPDGLQVAIGYADGKIELWRIDELEPYATLQHDSLSLWKTDRGLLFQLSFSPDSKTLVAFKFAPYLNANRLTFWRILDATLISVSDAARYYKFPETAYLPDGKTLLVFARDDSYLKVNLWDVETGTKLSEFGTGLANIYSSALAVTGDQLTLYGSDAQKSYFRQVRALPHGNSLESEKLDEISEDEDLSRFEDLLLGQGHYDNSWGNEDNPEVARLISSQRMPIQIAQENHILVIPEGIIKPSRLPQNVKNAYYDPQGNYIAWCEPGILNFLDDGDTTTSTALPFNSDCDGLVVSQQKHYASIWTGNTFYLLNIVTGKYSKASFDVRSKSSPMLSAFFSSDEQLLVTSKVGLITVWQVDPFQRLADSSNSKRSSGNNVEIALSEDKTLGISLAASRGSTSDRTSRLLVWRVQDVFQLQGITPPLIGSSQPMFTSFVLSPDSSLIASGDDYGGIRFWSVQSGEQLALFEVDARPLDLAFTPDGSGLVVVLNDGTVRVFGVP